MEAAKTPAERPPRTPLQELRLQPSAGRTGMTPLFRRLQLKDHDCATPVSCRPRPYSSITEVPCIPGRPRSATLVTVSSTTPVPCTPGPVSSTLCTVLELPTNPTLTPGASEAPSNPTLTPGASEPPSNPTLTPGASEAPSNPTLTPGASEAPSNPTLTPGASEPPSNPTLTPGASEPPSNPTLTPGASEVPSNPTLTPGASEPPSNPTLTPGASEPPSNPTLTPGASEPPSNPTLTPGASEPPSNPTLTPGASEAPSNPTLMPGASEPPSNPTLTPGASEVPSNPTLTPGASEVPSNPTLTPGASEPPSNPTLTPGASEPPSNPTLTPGASEPPSNPTLTPGASEAPSNPTLTPGASEPPSNPTLTPGASEVPSNPTLTPGASEVPSNPTLTPGASEPPSNPTLTPGALEPTSSTSPKALGSPIPEDSTPEPAPLCSSILIPSTLESPGNTTPRLSNIISSVPCTPNSLDSTTLAPCTSGSLHSARIVSFTPGPPGTSSTPQEDPFRGWRAAPPDSSYNTVASEPPSGGWSAGPLLCQGTPEGAKSPALAHPKQSPFGLPPIEASGLEPAGSEAIITPVASPESALGAVSWMLPLVWLEKTLNAPSLLESPRHSLSLHTSWQDGSVTPVPTMAAGTSATPVPTMAAGTSTTPVPTMAAGTSTTPVPTMAAGTSMTPVPTMAVGTFTTPVPTMAAGTSTTPVPTMAVGTFTTPVPTMAAGTSTTPVPTMAAGTSMAPVLTADIGTFMTPRDLWKRSINTSGRGFPCAKDSTTETDSLLWHCPREQLKTLPRAELEGRLESTLIIIEAVALQLRGWQESQWLRRGVGPAEQRDVLTQTDMTCPEGEEIYRRLYLEQQRKMEALQRQRGAERDLQQELELAAENMGAWSSQCLMFRGLVDAACQRLQDEQGALAQKWQQVRTLMSRCHSLLERVPSKLQSCLEERDAMRQQVDKALQAKEEAYCFLEAFRAHASARISARDQSLASQRELCTLLADAINLQTSLSAKTQAFLEFTDVTFENLQKERKAMNVEREQVRALVSRCKAVLERVPCKLQSHTEERDAMRQQVDEALQAKEETSCQLKETLVALRDTEAQLEQLTVANSSLGTDLSSLMTNLASVEQERDALQQANEKQQEKMGLLAREKNTLQQKCDELSQELQEVGECQEFLNAENLMSHTQLLEVEAKLNSTQAKLNSTQDELNSTQTRLEKHVLQHEELKDSYQRLREKHVVLMKHYESTKAELLDSQTKRSKISWCFKDIAECKTGLQELADCLKATLEEQDNDDAPSRSKAWTPGLRTPCQTPVFQTPARRIPHSAGSSLVGSVLKMMSGKDASEATRSVGTVTNDKCASTPKPIDPEESLLESMRELRAVVSNLVMLSSRIQELKQSKFKALQTEISNLELRLEKVTDESEEKIDAQAATITELNKVLRTKFENEKVLKGVVKQQEEKIFQLIDKSGEVSILKNEIFHLKRSLQHAETEAKVLWKELRGKEPKVDTTHIQERLRRQQEVDKLRLMLLEKENERQMLSDKNLEQVHGLEVRLRHAQKLLKTHEEMQEKMKKVLSAVPEVAEGCQELHSLLWYLGLKPSSKEDAEPQQPIA